jgi:murein DD-endopeptidase MepM/ murein hydrolase activator NlpD
MSTSASDRFSRPLRLFMGFLSAFALVVAVLAFMGRLDVEEPSVAWVDYDGSLPRGGMVEFQITAIDRKPGLRSVVLRIDDSPPIASTPAPPAGPTPTQLAATHLFLVDTTTLSDGPHTIAVDARDRALLPNLGQAFEMLIVDNTPPTLEPPDGDVIAAQGHTTALFVRADEALAHLEAAVFDRVVSFHPVGGEGLHRALVGFGVKEEPGVVDVTLHALDLSGNPAQATLQIQLADEAWPSGGYIALSGTQVKAQAEKDKGAAANQKRGDAYAQASDPEQLWYGTFARPARGPVTSPFGKVRTYSTGAERHHLGVDIANTVGTPIVAPAAGVVTLAEELHVYGNAVVLSHGHGISSSYNHLHEIDVRVGDRVAPGQTLGKMGSTGQSTGSHLHWGMVANGIAVNPLQWLEEDFVVETVED